MVVMVLLIMKRLCLKATSQNFNHLSINLILGLCQRSSKYATVAYSLRLCPASGKPRHPFGKHLKPSYRAEITSKKGIIWSGPGACFWQRPSKRIRWMPWSSVRRFVKRSRILRVCSGKSPNRNHVTTLLPVFYGGGDMDGLAGGLDHILVSLLDHVESNVCMC